MHAARYGAEGSVEMYTSRVSGYTGRRFVQGKIGIRLSPPGAAATVASLKVVQLSLERLDGAVCHLQVLVETVSFGDELTSDVRYSH